MIKKLTPLLVGLTLTNCVNVDRTKINQETIKDTITALEELVSYSVVSPEIDEIIRLVKINPTMKYGDNQRIVFEKYVITKDELISIKYIDSGKIGADDKINNYDSLKIYKVNISNFSNSYKNEVIHYNQIKNEILDKHLRPNECYVDNNIMGNPKDCDDKPVANYNEYIKLIRKTNKIITRGPCKIIINK